MEQDAVRSLGEVEAGNGISFFVRFGITAADQHYTSCRTRVELHCLGIEVCLVYAFKQFHDIALNAQHDAFRLWVSHTDIVFYHHGLVLHIDKSQEDETFVQDAFFAQAVDGGLYNAFAHFCHKFVVGERNGCHAAHTAGIQSFVAFSDAFIVFGHRQYFIMLAVAQHENRALYSAKEFLDDHFRAGIAEHTAEHLFQLFPGFFQCRENQYAFTCAQAVGFQYVGGGEGFQKSKPFFQRFGCHAFVAGGGNVMAQHEFFGEFFAAFQLRAFCRRADNGDVPGSGIFFETIENTLHQRIFGTHYNHVNLMLKGKSLESGEISSFDVYILAHCACSRVAGSDIQFFYFGALRNLPSQSVFAAT